MPKSLIAYIVCVIFLFASVFAFNKWHKPYSAAVIHGDVAGYYLYLPAYFYDDLGQLYNMDINYIVYRPTGAALYGAKWHKEYGNYVMKYTMGQALMYLPAFMVAHVWASVAGYTVNGYTLPYQFCMAIWSAVVACVGLWYMRKILLLYFDDIYVAASLWVICVASNYYFYITYDGGYTHGYLFTLYTLIIYLTNKWYQKPTHTGITLLGLFCGLTVLTRPSEIVCVLIPFLWGVESITAFKQRLRFLVQHYYHLILFVLYGLLTGIIQFWYWKKYTGHFIFWSYDPDEGFNFLHPHIMEVLFSYKKGWFIYTPVMLLVVPGFVALYRHKRHLFWGTIVFTVINVYIICSWKMWWYGGTFSQRALVQSYAVLIFPITSLFEYLSKQKIVTGVLICFLLFCSWLNIMMTYQVATEEKILDPQFMTERYFWRIFGKVHITNNDRKLLDTDEEMPQRFESLLQRLDTAPTDSVPLTDSSFYFNGEMVWALTLHNPKSKDIKAQIHVLSGKWLRVHIMVYTPEREYYKWKQTRFTLKLAKGDSVIKENKICLQPQIKDSTWTDVYQDIQVPYNIPVNTLAVSFWNNLSESPVYLKRMQIMYAK